LVDSFWRDEEKNFPRGGYDGSLLGNIVGLALEGEVWEMVNLGEEIQGYVGLPESNFITLV
jgi:hypothetical protein